MTELSNDLKSWDDIKESVDWSGLLIGNGFSQNIWNKFGYHSLFEMASTGEGAQLTSDDVALFTRLGTKNFEAILSALWVSKVVASVLGQPSQVISERESSIREALIRAVHGVHVPWAKIEETTLNHIANSLKEFSSIYCTNYDLLIYWAMMTDTHVFRDYMWSGSFDLMNTDIWGKKTAVHFIHGGLHLYRQPSGQTVKRTASENKSLLELFATPFGDALPLFISEGTAKEKLSSIYRSDYLSFVFSKLIEDDQPMVIFGNSLSKADKHIVDAIGSHRGRDVAISMRYEGNIREKKAGIIKLLPHIKPHFFDSATHPLGRPQLNIPGEP